MWRGTRCEQCVPSQTRPAEVYYCQPLGPTVGRGPRILRTRRPCIKLGSGPCTGPSPQTFTKGQLRVSFVGEGIGARPTGVWPGQSQARRRADWRGPCAREQSPRCAVTGRLGAVPAAVGQLLSSTSDPQDCRTRRTLSSRRSFIVSFMLFLVINLLNLKICILFFLLRHFFFLLLSGNCSNEKERVRLVSSQTGISRGYATRSCRRRAGAPAPSKPCQC